MQFQRAMSLAELMARFGTQAQCEAALFAWLQSVEKVTHVIAPLARSGLRLARFSGFAQAAFRTARFKLGVLHVGVLAQIKPPVMQQT